MANQLHVNVVAVEERVWSGEAEMLVARTTEGGKRRGEIRPDVDGDELATVMVTMLEGAVMMSRLYGDDVHVVRAAAHLRQHLEESVRAA